MAAKTTNPKPGAAPGNTLKPKVAAGSGEGMDTSDYIAGGFYILVSLALLYLLGRYYWTTHGGSFDKFAFWDTGNKKWFEVLFWSVLSSIAQNTGWGAYEMSQAKFQKRQILLQFARIVEAPFISLALIFVLFNLGVAFGDVAITLSEVPITVVVAFTIVASFFAWRTKEALDEVAKWFVEKVAEAIKGGN